MNEIPITDIIRIDDPTQYKLHAARRQSEGVEPLDNYVQSREEWVGWNRWRGTKSDFNRTYIFALMDFYHEPDMWLFGGIFEVLEERTEVQKSEGYKIKELDEYAPYTGRLKIKLRPSRGRAFRLETYLDNMTVSELFKEPYSGEVFPGYENINHDFERLMPIFENQNPGWKGALENVKGVYVVMDKSNGKCYVGAAYGESGIWSRWSEYMSTGHGYNDELVKLIEEKGTEYAREHFRLSLLEYRPMKADDQVIIDREVFWKKVFLSREFGYNEN